MKVLSQLMLAGTLALSACQAGDISWANGALDGDGFTVQCLGSSGQECVETAELWSCQEFISLDYWNQSCTRTPDGREGWTCSERPDGRAICVRPEMDKDVSGPGWTCNVDEFKGTICVTSRPLADLGPSIVPPGGTGVWECELQEFGIVCVPADDGSGSGEGQTPDAGEVPPSEGGDEPGSSSQDGGDAPSSDAMPRPGEFRSQTPGGWGAPAAGNNPGAYRDAHFTDAFPDGLTIGCEGGYQVTFTSAKAVEVFLPAGGTPGVLDGDAVDPSALPSAGVFAGHLVALTLAAGFDAYDPSFGSSDVAMTSLVALSGSCSGMTAGQILNAANAVIGGCDARSPAEIKDCAAAINENFVDGARAGGYLGYP
jgi:hypothetical protein